MHTKIHRYNATTDTTDTLIQIVTSRYIDTKLHGYKAYDTEDTLC